MVDKFQKLFDNMDAEGKTQVELELDEVSIILALLKANDEYMKTLEKNLFASFEKIKK